MDIFSLDTEFSRLILAMHSEELDNSIMMTNLENAKKVIDEGGNCYAIEDSSNGVKKGYVVEDRNSNTILKFLRK